MRLIDADALKDRAFGKRGGLIHTSDIDEMPTIEPQPQWIPCSERLPEASDKVLCCTATKKGQKNIVIGYYIADKEYWACGMNSNVIAWMPLPDVFVEET